jgi:TPR repeat protein
VEAEQYVHTLLETKGYRLSPSREFFVAPVKDVVDAVIAAERYLRPGAIAAQGAAVAPSEDYQAGEPWREVLGLADAAYYGHGETFQNETAALDLYRKARRLGSADACLQIGRILKMRGSAEPLWQETLECLEEGARRGKEECFAELGQMFFDREEWQNSHKAWSQYFASRAFLGRTMMRGLYGWQYLTQRRSFGYPMECREAVRLIRDEVSAYGQKFLERARKRGNTGARKSVELDARVVDCLLYPERYQQTAVGAIESFSPESPLWVGAEDRGRGEVRLISGAEAWFNQTCLIGGGMTEGWRPQRGDT